MARKELIDFFKYSAVQELINKNDFDGLYRLFDRAFGRPDEPHIWELTQLLLDAGIDFLKYMRRIPKYCFFSTNVEIVDIPSRIQSIGDCAFMNCHKLLEVYIEPKASRKIGSFLFFGCDRLQGIYFNGHINEWWQMSFDKNWCFGVPPKTYIACYDKQIIWL